MIATKDEPNSCLMFIQMLKIAWKRQETCITGIKRGSN